MLKIFANYKSITDENLMVKFERGDSSAFEELYKRYSSKLIYYLSKLLKNDIDKAKDLMQDVFYSIIKNPKSFNPNMKFSVWIYKIAYNKFINEYHKNKTIDYVDEFNDDIGFQEDYEMELDKSIINQTIDKVLELMSTDHKTTFILKYRENYSLQEISEVMNCPVGTVKSRIFNILKRITISLHKNEINKEYYYEK